MHGSHLTVSYIIPTRNRLPFLRKCLETLHAHKKEDEEIIVIDGGSTDGTPEYLNELHARGEVDCYVSEQDKGLGHAINKGFLLARGELMKTISDDDVYHYEEMQKCKEFMLAHPEIDALGTNGTDLDGKDYRREEDFLLWKKGPYHPFMIAELGLWLRRSSIPIFGLADTSFFFWDGEFTIRLTAGKARLAWYTGKTWEHVLQPDSVSITKSETWARESARLRRMYPIYSSWRHLVPKPIRVAIRAVVPKQKLAGREVTEAPVFLS